VSELALAARAATFWSAVVEFAQAREKDAKAQMERALDEGDVQVEKFRVTNFEGRELALVYITEGRWSVTIDERTLLNWVERRHPSEITKTIRPAYLDGLKKLVTEGQGVAADPATGEVIPGITARQNPSYLTVRKTPLARENVQSRLDELANILGYRLTQGDVPNEPAAIESSEGAISPES
jgi:hypothetical protein